MSPGGPAFLAFSPAVPHGNGMLMRLLRPCSFTGCVLPLLVGLSGCNSTGSGEHPTRASGTDSGRETAASTSPHDDAGKGTHDAGTTQPVGNNDGSDVDAQTIADGNGKAITGDAGNPPSATCTPLGLPCVASDGGGTPCCSSSCDIPDGGTGPNGYCGGCIAEGVSCVIGGPICCDDVSCTSGKCGTTQCLADNAPCGNAEPCCNDNCNGTTCGGKI